MLQYVPASRPNQHHGNAVAPTVAADTALSPLTFFPHDVSEQRFLVPSPHRVAVNLQKVAHHVLQQLSTAAAEHAP
jgi:hypothetical protein